MAMPSTSFYSSTLVLPHSFRSLSSSSTSLLHLHTRKSSSFRIRISGKPMCSSNVEPRKEEVVVVGAGIAGLATALSLHRLGVRSLVLEQAESLRTGGTSLTLFKNGWRVLDEIGVGAELRSQFIELQGMVIKAEDGRELRSFKFNDEVEGQEVRAVERGTLLESLANRLPADAIRFSSKLAKIETTEAYETLLELVDGTQLLPKIVIGCDGIRSPIAKWLGFKEPQYVGQCAFRGLAFYPDGQTFQPRVNYIYGRGLRAGYVPVSSTKVYWFVCFNDPSPGVYVRKVDPAFQMLYHGSHFGDLLPMNQRLLGNNSINILFCFGPKITDPSVLKKEVQNLVKNWPSELLNIIDRTPDDTIIKTPLVDRWLWRTGLSPSASSGGVILAGDAWHPMTPNLGQGACCALEDAVTLAGKLAIALETGPAALDKAFKTYENERWKRVFPLTIRAHLVGSLLQWENPVVCAIRNNIVIPKLVRLGPLLEHTNFTCEPLIKPEVSKVSS